MEKFYSEKDIRDDYRSLTKLLIQKNMTISTMDVEVIRSHLQVKTDMSLPKRNC